MEKKYTLHCCLCMNYNSSGACGLIQCSKCYCVVVCFHQKKKQTTCSQEVKWCVDTFYAAEPQHASTVQPMHNYLYHVFWFEAEKL